MTEIRNTTRRLFMTGFLALTLGLAGSAVAGNPGAPSTVEPSPVEPGMLEKLEAHLNAIRTLKAEFQQFTSQGGRASGTVALQRPGKMKIVYDPPTPFEIYADGTWLIYVDRELKEVNQLPISMTPADILLREEIDLGEDVRVEKLEERKGGWLLHLRHRDDPDAGRLILSFGASPIHLRGWIVTDPQGVTTTVALQNPALNQTMDPKDLIFDRPAWATIPEQD